MKMKARDSIIKKKFLGCMVLFAAFSQEIEAMTPTSDVCNLDAIYNDQFSFSFPRASLEGYLVGKGFPESTPYTAEEAERVKADIRAIFQEIMDKHPVQDRVAVISAGAPGVGKTHLFHQLLEEASSKGVEYAYICPDDVCLKNQKLTYLADIEAGDDSKETRLAAYNKWRAASNAATQLILANLIKDGFGFYYGTTSQSPFTKHFYQFLKDKGYRIHVIHVSAADDVRRQSVNTRDNTFIQSTDTDFVEKGLQVPQRIQDTFLKLADKIEFYHRPASDKDAVHAATWTRIEDSQKGTLKVHNPEALEEVKRIHNLSIEKLDPPKPELRWENTVDAAIATP